MKNVTLSTKPQKMFLNTIIDSKNTSKNKNAFCKVSFSTGNYSKLKAFYSIKLLLAGTNQQKSNKVSCRQIDKIKETALSQGFKKIVFFAKFKMCLTETESLLPDLKFLLNGVKKKILNKLFFQNIDEIKVSRIITCVFDPAQLKKEIATLGKENQNFLPIAVSAGQRICIALNGSNKGRVYLSRELAYGQIQFDFIANDLQEFTSKLISLETWTKL